MPVNAQGIPTQWWGYHVPPAAVMAWGARAIFKPSQGKFCLDILHDRQGRHFRDEDEAAFGEFVKFVNKNVMPGVIAIAQTLNPDDKHVFVRQFPWADESKVVVAQGSPNASFGYFYLSVSLVPAADAPPDQLTPWEVHLAAQRRQEAERQAEAQRVAPLIAADRKAARTTKKAVMAAVQERRNRSPHKDQGTTLEMGDHLFYGVNQGSRHAFCEAALDDEALIRYYMPNGRDFLVVVHRTTHGMVRNTTMKSLPKKWKDALPPQ
jgi:hypothetical protein